MTPTPTVNLSNEYAFGELQSLGQIINGAMPIIFSIAALSVVIYFLIGAVKFITSSGDKNAVAGARDMIVHAIIGFILLMLLFLIMEFIPQFFNLNLPIFQ